MPEEGSAESPGQVAASADEEAAEQMREFEDRDELPSDLSKWPDGKAKFLTFGGDEDAAYGEGKLEKLGPAITHHDDGSVSADGEKVENPDDYKGKPIPTPIENET